MNEPQTFRSAFNGFNREDVVNHIAYMSNKHETQTAQLRSENAALRAELEELRGEMKEGVDQRSRIPGLELAIAQQDAELAGLRAQLEMANQLLNEQEEQLSALREELEEAKECAAKPVMEKTSSHWDELRAYRRAETAERQARERVNALYDDATGALRTAGTALCDTTASFDTLAEQFRADLVALMDTIESGRSALGKAAETLDGLRPEMTE
jgi:chromosome segregation ATPase